MEPDPKTSVSSVDGNQWLNRLLNVNANNQPHRNRIYIVIAFSILYFIILLRTAWTCDDAYATFRVVDNLVNGYGLTWNVSERVQVPSNGLWMFLITIPYLVTREPYYTSIFLSIMISLATIALFGLKLAKSNISAVLGIGLLLASKAFVDYSTSGLENPLTNLLVVLFAVIFVNQDRTPRNLFLMSLIAALGFMNRQDLILIFLPALLTALVSSPGKRRAVGLMALGIIPAVAWELFCLFYYGFPFPNPAYAKTGAGIAQSQYVFQGLLYLLDSIGRDPITMITILSGLIVAFSSRDTRIWPFGAGSLLYLIFVVYIGGDFMSGRHLVTPLLCCVIVLGTVMESYRLPMLKISIVVLVILFGIVSPSSSLWSTMNYTETGTRERPTGIQDERGFYYRATGLLLTSRQEKISPSFNMVKAGLELRDSGCKVADVGNLGFMGYYAGPDVHLVEHTAVTDPLLARLPANTPDSWHIGHVVRAIPSGYLETLDRGRNLIEDKDLAQYYDKLSLIIRGDLFDSQRLITIFEFNTGKYDHLLQSYVKRQAEMKQPKPIVVTLDDVKSPRKEGTRWNEPPNKVIKEKQTLIIRLPMVERAPRLELSLDNNDVYKVAFYNSGKFLGSKKLPAKPVPGGGLALHSVNAPHLAVDTGYDEVTVTPVEGDGSYSLGHLRLIYDDSATKRGYPLY